MAINKTVPTIILTQSIAGRVPETGSRQGASCLSGLNSEASGKIHEKNCGSDRGVSNRCRVQKAPPRALLLRLNAGGTQDADSTALHASAKVQPSVANSMNGDREMMPDKPASNTILAKNERLSTVFAILSAWNGRQPGNLASGGRRRL
jgi:hypothetical protein